MIVVTSHPSLALIKYWGKKNVEKNIPATSSLAINLEAFVTTTKVALSDEDRVILNGKEAPLPRFLPFFERVRQKLSSNAGFSVESTTNFPVAAGLASSSSGFAALAFGCSKLLNPKISTQEISSFARLGSASAARSLFEGFTILPQGAETAAPLFPQNHWPELRVIIAIVKAGEKPISSREAMKRSALTSPLYPKWVEESESLFLEAKEAVKVRQLARLGPLMQKSYLQMFATQFTAAPPIFFWEPESLNLLKTLESLRNLGLNIWETMDAGPQVKILCEEPQLEQTLHALKKQHPNISFLTSKVGGATR